jgi:acetoin utilization deacetylase AcuC-like enzyme
MIMKIYYSPTCLSYQYPGHPESPQRIQVTHQYLEEKGYDFAEPQPCSDEDVLRVHSEELLTSIKTETFFNGDTPTLPGIIDYALLSAGSAIQASQWALNGDPAFSLMRPPGHHATRNRVMGFCYINNIAIAVAKALEEHAGLTAAILDIDCHHGNGTEDIFMGNPSVLYVSLHQSPLYPGTGLQSHANAVNFPLPPYTPEDKYLSVLDEACGHIADFKPGLLGISAGFDTFQEDPLTQLNLDVGTYDKIGKRIADLNKPTFVVMEGGYSARLPECVHAFIQGLEPARA